MLISMTPNEEVKTIHASLNDGSLRKWEFEPYTEQGKIELTDQDYSTIQSIKGNTVKFNQLIHNGNFADTSSWIATSDITFSATGNEATITRSSSGTSVRGIYQRKNGWFLLNHFYYISAYVKSSSITTMQVTISDNVNYSYFQSFQITSSYSKIGYIFQQTALNGSLNHDLYFGTSQNGTFNLKNVMVRDLTLMDIDNLTTPSQVEEWLSNNIGLLPYYDYTPGTLIPFKGTGLKTIGFNQWDEEYLPGYYSRSRGVWFNANNQICTKNKIKVLPDTQYYCYKNEFGTDAAAVIFYDADSRWLGYHLLNDATPFMTPSNCQLISVNFGALYGSTYNNDICINISNTSKNGTYEPYTESTLDLSALNTLFPTGMKDIPNTDVYDELIPSKATTRLGKIVFDGINNTMTFNGTLSIGVEAYGSISNKKNGLTNLVSDKFITKGEADLNCIRGRSGSNAFSFVCPSGSFADTVSLNTWLQSNPVTIIYELATPTSQDISLDLTYPIYQDGTEQILPVNSSTPTTSSMKATIEYPDRTEDVNFLYKQTSFESNIPQFSLVCKNQELPMTLNDDKLVCECDSSITNESGFFDCKVKMQDLESVAYSQKIQLHVERGIND